jgi:hypothetical protein
MQQILRLVATMFTPTLHHEPISRCEPFAPDSHALFFCLPSLSSWMRHGRPVGSHDVRRLGCHLLARRDTNWCHTTPVLSPPVQRIAPHMLTAFHPHSHKKGDTKKASPWHSPGKAAAVDWLHAPLAPPVKTATTPQVSIAVCLVCRAHSVFEGGAMQGRCEPQQAEMEQGKQRKICLPDALVGRQQRISPLCSKA